MRIGVLAPPWVSVPPPRYGGVETVVDALAVGYQAAGHDVRLFTVGDSTCPVPKFHLYDEAAEGDPAGATISELVHVLAAYEALADCDLVHDHTIAGPLIAPGPVVTTAHCPLDGDGARLYGRMSRSAIIVAASDAQVVPGVPVARVIHHGIDASAFPVGAGDGGYLLFLGKFTPEKGAHRALEAAYKSGQRLLLAGKVREPAERWYFERYVAPYLNDRLRFVGEVTHDEKRELLAGARGGVVGNDGGGAVRRAEPDAAVGPQPRRGHRHQREAREPVVPGGLRPARSAAGHQRPGGGRLAGRGAGGGRAVPRLPGRAG